MARRMPPASRALKGSHRQKGAGRARGHASREADRASEASPSASPCDLAWTPERLGSLGQSHWPDTGPKLARTPEGTRASSESSEPVPFRKRCRLSAGFYCALSQWRRGTCGSNHHITSARLSVLCLATPTAQVSRETFFSV